MRRPSDPWGLIAILVVAAAGSACDPEPVEPNGTDPAASTPISIPSPEKPIAPIPTVDEPPTGFPCDVHAVLQASCANCHAGRLYYGPNFATRADLFRPAAELFEVATHPIAPGTFGEHIATALRDGTMPPAYPAYPAYPARAIPTVAERQLVIDWIAAGMPAGDCGALGITP